MKRMLIVVAVSCIGLGMSWGGEGAGDLQQAWAASKAIMKTGTPLERSYPANEVKKIHIAIQRGKIQVTPMAGPVTLSISRLDHADLCDISTTLKGGELRVIAKTKGWLWGTGNVGDGIKIPHNKKSACSVSVTLSAPPDRPLSIAGSYADIAVGKWDSSAKFSVAYGKLQIDGVKRNLRIDSMSDNVNGTADSLYTHISSVGGSLHLAWDGLSPSFSSVEISEVRSDDTLQFPKKTGVHIDKSGWVKVSNQFAKDKIWGGSEDRNVAVHVSGVSGTLQIVKSENEIKENYK